MNNENITVNDSSKSEENDNKKAITGLKIAKGALTALAGVFSLITTPIASGIAVAVGLGAVVADIALENQIDNAKIAAVR